MEPRSKRRKIAPPEPPAPEPEPPAPPPEPAPPEPEPEPEESVQIIAEKLTGGVIAHITVPLSTTVRELRERVTANSAFSTRVNWRELELTDGGEAWEEEKTLGACGLKAGEVAKLMVVIDERPKIMVIGGNGRNEEGGMTTHKSTEIFNAHTETFTAGPEMGTARTQASVARLGKRRALVIGGRGHLLLWSASSLLV